MSKMKISNFRAISPDIWPTDCLERVNMSTVRELERIAAWPFSESTMKQALAPISFEGLGLPSATDRVKHLQLFSSPLKSIRDQMVSSSNFEDGLAPTPTQVFELPNSAKEIFEGLVQTGSPRIWLLLTQSKNPHSASFFTARPSGSTELNDEALSTTIRLRLGLEKLPPGYECGTHNVPFDTFAYHAFHARTFKGPCMRGTTLLETSYSPFANLLTARPSSNNEMGPPRLQIPSNKVTMHLTSSRGHLPAQCPEI